MNRVCQVLLIASTLCCSWLSMIGLHEAGHVLHAKLSGGRVARVILAPTVSARTELAHNPHPLFVAWGGGVWGVLVPVGVWAALRAVRHRYAWLAAFLAGFCGIANGAYLGVGAWFPAGDAADLLRLGAARWQLTLFGLTATVTGFCLWNGLGPYFGLGPAAHPIDRKAAVGVAVATALIGVVEWLWSG